MSYEIQNSEYEIIASYIRHGSDAAMFLSGLGEGYRVHDMVSKCCVMDMGRAEDRALVAQSYDDAAEKMEVRAKNWRKHQEREKRQEQIEDAFKRG